MIRVPLPTVFCVAVRTSWTWMLVVLSLTGISLYQLAPRSGSNTELAGWLAGSAFLIVGAVASLLAHEFGHIWLARRFGYNLDALEPSLFGALPDTCYVPHSPASDLRVASAGPLVSLVISALSGCLWLLLGTPDAMPGFSILLLGGFNLGLVALNMLPGYPFDGGRIFRAFMWYLNGDLVRATNIAAVYGQFFIVIAFLGGVVLLSAGDTDAVWGAWILTLCWTLNRARAEGVAQTVWREAGGRLQIDDLFQAGVNRVPASATIDESIESLLDNYRRGPTLVVDGSEIVGVVDLHSFRKTPRASWTRLTVGELMSEVDTLPRLESVASVTELLAELPSGSTKVVLVERNGKVIAAADRDFVLDRVQSYIRAERLNRPRRR
jgi:Zn-dependent protease